MDAYGYLAIAGIVILILVRLVASGSSSKRKVFKNNAYNYKAKSSLMTNTEGAVFRKIERAVSERYYIFPQVHLSAILDHRIEGQEWKYAFSHINGKSVDYVLCDKETLRPAYAIELDDYTHNRKDRQKRDREVERIFQGAGVPLVRFSDMRGLSPQTIIHALTEAKNMHSK